MFGICGENISYYGYVNIRSELSLKRRQNGEVLHISDANYAVLRLPFVPAVRSRRPL